LLSKVYIGTVLVIEVEISNSRLLLFLTDIRSACASVYILKLCILYVYKKRQAIKASKA
jgi:hypothetical protein